MAKQLLLQGQQFRSEVSADARLLGDGRQTAYQVRQTKLALLGGQVVVSREAIAHDKPPKAFPSSSMAAGVDRIRPCINTFTTAVNIAHFQPCFPVGLLPSALPVGRRLRPHKAPMLR